MTCSFEMQLTKKPPTTVLSKRTNPHFISAESLKLNLLRIVIVLHFVVSTPNVNCDKESIKKSRGIASASCKSPKWSSISLSEKCLLEFDTDNMLEWTWIELDRARTQQSRTGSETQTIFLGAIQLDLSETALDTLFEYERQKSFMTTTHKAKIYFPFRQPTEDKRCRFSYKYRKRVNPNVDAAREELLWANNHIWPRISLMLVRALDGQSDEKVVLPKLEQNSHSAADRHLGNRDPSLPKPLAEVLFLSMFQNRDYSEYNVSVDIGVQTGSSWRLVLEVETRLDASLLELSQMQLTNCASKVELTQTNDSNQNSILDIEQLFQSTCKDSSKFFQCKLSGRCIDLDYRCDFGSDCGPFDDSDEFNCHADFEGRCNFEQDDQCQWISAPLNQSWVLTSVTGPIPVRVNATGTIHKSNLKPSVDHTFRSPYGGHYMLLTAHQLDAFRPSQLIGPRVQLKRGYEVCKFRFWLHTAASLSGLKLDALRLTVGYDQLKAGDLFKHEKLTTPKALLHSEQSQGWRRFQVTLLNRSQHSNSIHSLRISLNNLKQDLELFALSDGYLALDDFSFSPGCALTIYKEAPKSICNEAEFRCSVAAPQAPGQFCIPLNRVCDFKPDCGFDEKLQSRFSSYFDEGTAWQPGLASDELMCAGKFDVTNKYDSFEMSGLHLAREYSSISLLHESKKEATNEAFAVDLPRISSSDNSAYPLIVSARFEEFERNFANPKKTSKIDFITDVGIILPRFHQAHANCVLGVSYAWSNNAENLVAKLYLLKSRASILFATLKSADRNMSASSEFVRFGIGEQNAPFNVYIEITFESASTLSKKRAERFKLDAGADSRASGLERYGGEFYLWGYQFMGCAHTPSRINLAQAHVVRVEDLSYDDGDESHDLGQTPEEVDLDNQLAVCSSNQFQCEQPNLCIEDEYLCDFQRDCQESGSDEIGCEQRGFVQFNFEPTNSTNLLGWARAKFSNDQAPPMENASAEWVVRRATADKRAGPFPEPPFDHTHRALEHSLGNYLTFREPKQRDALGEQVNQPTKESANFLLSFQEGFDPSKRQEIIYTPKFKLTNNCKRFVAYLYFWPLVLNGNTTYWTSLDELKHFQIFIKYFDAYTGQTLTRAKYLLWPSATKSSGWLRFAGWQRVLLKTQLVEILNVCGVGSISEKPVACDFAIGFQIDAEAVLADKIQLAIDDISFGPECELAAIGWGTSKPDSKALAVTTALPIPSVLLVLTLLASVSFSLWLLVMFFNRRRNLIKNSFGTTAQAQNEDENFGSRTALNEFEMIRA